VLVKPQAGHGRNLLCSTSRAEQQGQKQKKQGEATDKIEQKAPCRAWGKQKQGQQQQPDPGV
jgi:hypothetical protein